MKRSQRKIKISPTIGSVSTILLEPEKMKCLITLAHGAGAGMQHPFMSKLAEQLAEHSIGTLRFNFPYMEQKKKRPDVPAIAQKTIEGIINYSREIFPKHKIFASGKSFGGRMSSQFAASSESNLVDGLIFYGFPLHAPGKPSVDRADHLKKIKIPMLFLQGTKDTLATIDLMRKLCSSLKKSSLIEFEGADHSFKKGKEDHIELLAEHTGNWIESL